MGLLQWCQLRPHGQANDMAAVFFTKPVQVSTIRIFPTGAQPFRQAPELVATTEPAAFFLDVFFNALPSQPPANSQDSQDKRKNVLVPTRIAYAGGQTEFAVDMGAEYATRLIIFQGQFTEVSMAIYGEIVSEQPEIFDYEPKPVPLSLSPPLSSALDVANSTTPTDLAESLLALMSAPAPLSLLIRFMFCLKPEKEDWDNPDFPYVYSNLDTSIGDDDIENEIFDLESLVQTVNKPLKDNVPAESLTEFAGRMRDLLGSDVSDDAYYVAKLLTKSACQQSLFSSTLLQHIDLLEVFNEQSLDETTINCLSEAAANIKIAKYFSEDTIFIQSLEDMINSPKTERPIQKALNKLMRRIHGWKTFEVALTNPHGDFAESSAFLKDISTDEFALGCWLECMLTRDDLASKLAQNPTHPEPRPTLPHLFRETPPAVSHDDFIMFARAFLGVTTVLAMLAWSDSLGDDLCCERTLNILVAWQGVDGYREILNHCLLVRQMTRRMEWIKNDEDDQKPKRAGILVERLLLGLTKDPQSMLSNDLTTTVLALKPPFCLISADELLEMEKLARVAQDGLLSAFEEIAFDSVRPFSLRRLRVLRVSVAIIVAELVDEDGEWHVIETFWNERSQALISRCVSILTDISTDLNRYFALDTIPGMRHALSDLLLRTGRDFLQVILRLARSYPLPTRDLRSLTATVADLYICCDATTMAYSPSSPVYGAAEDLMQTCLKVLSDLSGPDIHAAQDVLAAQAILRTVLEHASKNDGRDPVHHVLQLYNLVDSILPPENVAAEEATDVTYWAHSIFPHVLHDIKAFSALLDPNTRLQFIDRIVRVDNGEVCLGEWLLEEELKDLSITIQTACVTRQHPDYQRILQYQLSAGIQLLDSLVSSPTNSPWVIPSFSSNSNVSLLLNHWLSSILDASLVSSSLTHFGRSLATRHSDFDPDLRFTILLLLLRNAQQDPSLDDALNLIPEIMKNLPSSVINSEALRNEVGRLFSVYSDHASILNSETGEKLFQIIEWLSVQEDIRLTTLTGISADGFDYLCTTVSSLISPERSMKLSTVRPNLSIDDDEFLPPSSIELPEAISLPLQSVENLLSPKPKEPSTPKGTKTPDILGVIISPPTALLRSPAATGLTKTYMNNDFRQLRQTVSTRLNTSRLPSTHADARSFPFIFIAPFYPGIPVLVDEFQNTSMVVDLLPAIDTTAFQGLPGSL